MKETLVKTATNKGQLFRPGYPANQPFSVWRGCPVTVAVSVLGSALALFCAAPLMAGDAGVGVCHGQGDGSVNLISISANALQTHLAHGDVLPSTWYLDGDADGSGDPGMAITTCAAPFGYVEDALDCDDLDSTVGPGAVDACGDGVDQDCSGSDPLCSAEIDGWRVTAGAVTDSGLEDYTVTGTFTLERLSASSAFVRFGGACILADLVDRGIGGASCSSNDDCAVAPGSGLPAGSYGYCTSPDGSGEPNRCWTRLGDGCIRGPQVPGTQELPPVPAAFTPDDGNPVRWLVIACLASEINPFACRDLDPGNYVYSVGPVTVWEW